MRVCAAAAALQTGAAAAATWLRVYLTCGGDVNLLCVDVSERLSAESHAFLLFFLSSLPQSTLIQKQQW